MRQSIQSLQSFYEGPLGDVAVRMATRRLTALWPHLNGSDFLGYGYTRPYLETYGKSAHRLISALPITPDCHSKDLVSDFGHKGENNVVVMDAQLPFQPSVFDHVLMVHALEETPNPHALLKEIHRVMKPEARLVVIAANRAGMWARSDRTPFGAGRPFTARQLSEVLRNTGFTPLVRSGAAYGPPHPKLSGTKLSGGMEKFGETVWPGFSGIILVEAVKRLYAARDGRQGSKVRRPSFNNPGALGVPGKVAQKVKLKQK